MEGQDAEVRCCIYVCSVTYAIQYGATERRGLVGVGAGTAALLLLLLLHYYSRV